MIVSELYTLLQAFTVALIGNYVPMGRNHLVNAVSSPIAFVCAIQAVIAMFYLLSGFLADVCCGRFKTIIVGLTIILISFITAVVTLVVWISVKDTHQQIWVFVSLKESVPTFVLGFGAAGFFVIGYAAYQANFIQFGLDQLIELSLIHI